MAKITTTYADRDVQYPNRYKDQANVQYTLTRDEGTVNVAGTLINANTLNEIKTVVNGLDDYRIADETNITSNTTSITNLNTGWVNPAETWEYVSVDDPTGVFRVHADVTTKYSVGMRIKFTNGGNVIYGIITAVGPYSGGYTSITFLHQIDPADSLALYLMANSAITANYYSSMKVPFGFPLTENSWTVFTSYTSDASQSSPGAGTWYNLGTVYRDVPIGAWKLGYKVSAQNGNSIVSSQNRVISTTLSTVNNSNSNPEFMMQMASVSVYIRIVFEKVETKYISAKQRWYLNTMSDTATGDIMYNLGAGKPTQIIAVCAYL